MVFTRHEPIFRRSDPAIAFADGVETPYSISLKRDRIRLNKDKKWVSPPHVWVASLNGEYHILPRGKVKSKVSATNWEISNSQFLASGDKLTYVQPHLSLEIATMTVGDSTTLTVEGKPCPFTFAGTSGATTTNAATELVDLINNSAYLSSLVHAIAQDNFVHLFANDGISLYTVSVAGAGTINVSDSGLMVADKELGAIANFSESNYDEVILTAAAANEPPVGASVGVVVNRIVGLYDEAMEWTHKTEYLVAPVVGAHGINKWALNYYDDTLKALFPKMTFLEH